MAEAIQIGGSAVTVKVDTGTSNALETLSAGGLRNGSELEFIPFTLPIHTDDHGGDEGPPSEEQFLGEICRIRLIFNRWDAAIEAKILQRIYGSVTAGTPPAPGTLMFPNAFRLLIQTTNRPYNFPLTVFKDPHQINVGTKHSALVLTGTAYEGDATNGVNGVLYNTTTSG